jgi:hypothetical protein
MKSKRIYITSEAEEGCTSQGQARAVHHAVDGVQAGGALHHHAVLISKVLQFFMLQNKGQ